MATRCAIVLAGAIAVGCLLGAAGGRGAKEIVIAIPDYQREPYADLDTGTNTIVQAHGDVVDALLRQLRAPALPNDRKVLIIYSLGHLRDPRAASALIANIGLRAEKMDPKLGFARWRQFPAQEALVRIGRHASWVLMSIIGSAKFDKAQVGAYARVLSDIEQPRYAVMKLKDRAKQVTDEAAKEQFQLVIDRIQSTSAGNQ